MSTRSRPTYEAEYRVERQLIEIGLELRKARRARGRTQVAVAAAAGMSGTHLCRIERGHARAVSYRTLARLAAAIGLTLSLKAFPGGRSVLDEPQLSLFRDLRVRTHPGLRWRVEVPMPIPGDLRAADAVSTFGGGLVVFELWTRLADFQAQTRAALLKKRDLQADRLVVVLRATHANRDAVRRAGPAATAAFPLGTRAVLLALAQGRLPETDGLVFLPADNGQRS